MNIGLNPGPGARTVKPGPRHLRTRPDPGQNRLGPHKVPVYMLLYIFFYACQHREPPTLRAAPPLRPSPPLPQDWSRTDLSVPRFYLARQTGVIQPGHTTEFSFNFKSELPGIFAEVCIRWELAVSGSWILGSWIGSWTLGLDPGSFGSSSPEPRCIHSVAASSPPL